MKFSTMPLTTTWTRSPVSKWGCAFSSVTRPWVAHRVWPIPEPGRRRRDGHAAVAVAVQRFDRRAQPRQVADRADRLEPVVALHGDPGRVIAAVLELLQPPQQVLLDRAGPDVSDDPAHGGGL